jgi:hypothetical protein
VSLILRDMLRLHRSDRKVMSAFEALGRTIAPSHNFIRISGSALSGLPGWYPDLHGGELAIRPGVIRDEG